MSIAYSKMWFVEELEQMQNYKKMVFAEFLDFLARLSFLVWPDDDEDLSQKIWRLMQKLFNQIKEKVKEAVIINPVDSESDYEDELASEILSKNYPEEMYAGFGVIKPQKRPDDEALKQLLGDALLS